MWKTLGSWTLRVLGGLAVLALLALGALYLLSERIVAREHAIEGHRVEVPTDSASVAEGARLARLRGCYDGCHGEGTGGEVFVDPPGLQGFLLGRVVAPDLGRLAEEWSTVELERAIRHGVRPDGRSTLAMPSSMFQHLSDEDLGRILAFLESRSPVTGMEREVRLGPMARLFLVREVFTPQAEEIDQDRPHPEATPRSDPLAHGEYLARTVCTECHGQDLEGAGETGSAPPLVVVAGYDREAFARLMATGDPPGDRELGLMKGVAVSRFSHLTDREVEALYAYLRSRIEGLEAGSETGS